MRSSRLGVDYVEVADEPVHVECFRNEWVRVYLATLEPGTSTLYHRHAENTLYIVIRGGPSQSDAPGRQKQRMPGLGRSLRPATRVSMALQRLITGVVNLPTSACVMQFHRQRPLIHRVCTPAHNAHALKLLGVELLATSVEPLPAQDLPGLALEYRDDQVSVYRIQLARGQSTVPCEVTAPCLLVIIAGTATLDALSPLAADVLETGAAQWLGHVSGLRLENTGAQRLDAFLVVLR